MNIGIMKNIINEETDSGTGWLTPKCVILIFVTLALVLYYGRDTIMSVFGVFSNFGKIVKTIIDSFKMAAGLAIQGTQIECEKKNIKMNIPKNNNRKVRGKHREILKYDNNNCLLETFIVDRCTDDEYRFVGKNNLCYKNILDANNMKGDHCQISSGQSPERDAPVCNKYKCVGEIEDGLMKNMDMDKNEIKIECSKRIINGQKEISDSDGTIRQINIGQSPTSKKEVGVHIDRCSTIPLNYDGFSNINTGSFNFIKGDKNSPGIIMRTDADQGWSHNLSLLCSEKIFTNEKFYDNLEGGDWSLVRRSYGKWHKASDKCFADSNITSECDWTSYLNRYPDLQKAFGTDIGKAERHYYQYGKREKRDCSNTNKGSSGSQIYGDFRNSDVIKSSFSRKIPLKEYTQLLFSNDEIDNVGLPTKWIIINKEELHTIVGNTIKVFSSSVNKNPHEIATDKSKGLAINIKGWGNDNKDWTIYMENSFEGATAGRNYKNVHNKGVNVFVRNYVNFTQIGAPVATSHHWGWGGNPERAIDGNDAGEYRYNSVTHTHRHRFAWWEVDLKQDYPISKIEIFNRWESRGRKDHRRLHNFDVKIDGAVVKSFGYGQQKVYTVNINPPKKGRTIKIQYNGKNHNYLSLAEVKVWGVNMDKENRIEAFMDRQEEIETFNDKLIDGKGEPEIYNIDKQYSKFKDAEAACKHFGGKLASEDDINRAYRKGGQWCSPGWVKAGKVLDPIQRSVYNTFPQKLKDENMCGPGPGIHEKDNNPNNKYGVNCIGRKPKPDPSRLITNPSEVPPEKPPEEIIDMSSVGINPYSPNKWSTSSSMATGYKGIPPIEQDQVDYMEKTRLNELFTDGSNATKPLTNKKTVDNFVFNEKELSEELYNAIQKNF